MKEVIGPSIHQISVQSQASNQNSFERQLWVAVGASIQGVSQELVLCIHKSQHALVLQDMQHFFNPLVSWSSSSSIARASLLAEAKEQLIWLFFHKMSDLLSLHLIFIVSFFLNMSPVVKLAYFLKHVMRFRDL